MRDTQRIPWKRLSAEAAAIVASILLAFAIDAWWESLAASEDEVQSLELIRRDVSESVAQLELFLQFTANTSQKALGIYKVLSGPGPYDRDRIHNDMVGVDRRTMRLPRAAYTDLLSTGNLRIIRDRELRDAIVTFYANTELAELVIQKNNDNVLDAQLLDAYIGDGLIYSHARGDIGLLEVDATYARIDRLLGPDFRHAEDPMWKYAPDSPQWDRLRSVLINAAVSYAVAEDLLEPLKNEAVQLEQAISSWLDAQ